MDVPPGLSVIGVSIYSLALGVATGLVLVMSLKAARSFDVTYAYLFLTYAVMDVASRFAAVENPIINVNWSALAWSLSAIAMGSLIARQTASDEMPFERAMSLPPLKGARALTGLCIVVTFAILLLVQRYLLQLRVENAFHTTFLLGALGLAWILAGVAAQRFSLSVETAQQPDHTRERRILYQIAHDMRSPLAALNNIRRPLTETQHEYAALY